MKTDNLAKVTFRTNWTVKLSSNPDQVARLGEQIKTWSRASLLPKWTERRSERAEISLVLEDRSTIPAHLSTLDAQDPNLPPTVFINGSRVLDQVFINGRARNLKTVEKTFIRVDFTPEGNFVQTVVTTKGPKRSPFGVGITDPSITTRHEQLRVNPQGDELDGKNFLAEFENVDRHLVTHASQ